MEEGLHISFASERLFTLWGIPIPNTLMAAWMVVVVLGIVAFFVGRKPQMVPRGLQNVFEMLFDFVLDFMEQTLGSRKLAVQYFPLIVTIFLFIFTSNLFDFLPFFGSVGIHHGDEFIPLFHAVNTDLNATLALSIVAVLSTQIAGILALGVWRYAGKFFNLKSPLKFFDARVLSIWVLCLKRTGSRMSRASIPIRGSASALATRARASSSTQTSTTRQAFPKGRNGRLRSRRPSRTMRPGKGRRSCSGM